MTVQEQIELQQYVKTHQSSLGCAELKRRSRLIKEADKLVNRLIRRALKFKRVDHAQAARSLEALSRAMGRLERREKAYYGA